MKTNFKYWVGQWTDFKQGVCDSKIKDWGKSRKKMIAVIHMKGREEMIGFCFLMTCCLVTGVWLRDPMDCSPPSFPVLHHLLEFAQAHVHWVGDAIQPSHSLLPLSPSVLNLSQHQGLFQWVSSLHQLLIKYNSLLTLSRETRMRKEAARSATPSGFYCPFLVMGLSLLIPQVAQW